MSKTNVSLIDQLHPPATHGNGAKQYNWSNYDSCKNRGFYNWSNYWWSKRNVLLIGQLQSVFEWYINTSPPIWLVWSTIITVLVLFTLLTHYDTFDYFWVIFGWFFVIFWWSIFMDDMGINRYSMTRHDSVKYS